MVTRRVKFNIKNFIEDYMYAKEVGDDEEVMELMEMYNHCCSTSSPEIFDSIRSYIRTNKIGSQFPELLDVIQVF